MFDDCLSSRNEARSHLQSTRDDLQRAAAVNQNIYGLNIQLTQTVEAQAAKMQTLQREVGELTVKCAELEGELANLTAKSAASQASYHQTIEALQTECIEGASKHFEHISRLGEVMQHLQNATVHMERESNAVILQQHNEMVRREREHSARIDHQQREIERLERERAASNARLASEREQRQQVVAELESLEEVVVPNFIAMASALRQMHQARLRLSQADQLLLERQQPPPQDLALQQQQPPPQDDADDYD